jgi:hypothetical protein
VPNLCSRGLSPVLQTHRDTAAQIFAQAHNALLQLSQQHTTPWSVHANPLAQVNPSLPLHSSSSPLKKHQTVHRNTAVGSTLYRSHSRQRNVTKTHMRADQVVVEIDWHQMQNTHTLWVYNTRTHTLCV